MLLLISANNRRYGYPVQQMSFWLAVSPADLCVQQINVSFTEGRKVINNSEVNLLYTRLLKMGVLGDKPPKGGGEKHPS